MFLAKTVPGYYVYQNYGPAEYNVNYMVCCVLCYQEFLLLSIDKLKIQHTPFEVVCIVLWHCVCLVAKSVDRNAIHHRYKAFQYKYLLL